MLTQLTQLTGLTRQPLGESAPLDDEDPLAGDPVEYRTTDGLFYRTADGIYCGVAN